MKHLCTSAIVAAMLLTSSVGIAAAPAKPPKPTKPTPPPPPPEDIGPTTGEIIMCMATGNSIQVCMVGNRN